jgi:hypothetical protein
MSSFDGDKNKTNHCDLKLICKILCKIEKFQCVKVLDHHKYL